MKKLLLFSCSFLIALSANSQQKIADYQIDYFSAMSYDIKVAEGSKNELYKVYVDIQNSDQAKNTLNLIFNDKTLKDFKAALEASKNKYVEWRQVAIDNNVEEVAKKIDVKYPSVRAGFIYGREWFFDFSVKLSPRFLVMSGKYLLIISTDKLVASDNQFITSEGMLVFSNAEEIDMFLSKLNEDEIVAAVQNKTSTVDLFE